MPALVLGSAWLSQELIAVSEKGTIKTMGSDGRGRCQGAAVALRRPERCGELLSQGARAHACRPDSDAKGDPLEFLGRLVEYHDVVLHADGMQMAG